jgi:hypothetical protein
VFSVPKNGREYGNRGLNLGAQKYRFLFDPQVLSMHSSLTTAPQLYGFRETQIDHQRIMSVLLLFFNESQVFIGKSYIYPIIHAI